jgi:hypothetical protein
MKLRFYLRRAMSLPPRVLVEKAVRQVQRRLGTCVRRTQSVICSTYEKTFLFATDNLYRYFTAPSLDGLLPHAKEIAELADHYLAHHFNVLGSGWVHVRHGVPCSGLEGYRYEMGSSVEADGEGHWLKGRINFANLNESQRLWHLIDTHYIPVDWQLDFRSGYRWSEETWYLNIPSGHKSGVDIKVPWELSRMQHLPTLALAYGLATKKQPGFTAPERYVREFRNQVLDFIATNPPRFGVNWRSTMDVGIRAVNWLVAHDLFRSFHAEFDDEFQRAFNRSIYEHGLHIVRNLEWDPESRGNHYLSNVVSLLFVAAYLPCSLETNAWLAFGVQELVYEAGHQFHAEGTNFEASTSYHRLSAEMVLYATALILGLLGEKTEALKTYADHFFKGRPKLKPAPITFHPLGKSGVPTPLPVWYIERLEKMAEFTMAVTKPNRHIVQIGDNDSGRFLKLNPFDDEDRLDHRHLVAAINGLFDRKDFAEFTDSGWVETRLVKHLGRGIHLPSYKGEDEPGTAERAGMSVLQTIQGLKFCAYPDFGVYIFRSKDVYLAIRCGSIGQNGHGGHAHNDNLSFELSIRGRDFIVDGGSYLYTPFPEIRNRFRSTGAHSTLAVKGREQNRWTGGLQGLFSMRDDAQGRVLEQSRGSFRGEHHGFGPRHYRQFEWSDSSLIIEDFLETDSSNEINLNLAPDVQIIHVERNGVEEFFLEIRNGDIDLEMLLRGFSGVEACDGFFSSGYGKRVTNRLVKCYRSEPQTRIEIRFELRGR